MIEELKREVCAGNKKLLENGLVMFTWGNLSAIDRKESLIAIKPSGVSYDMLTPEDIIILDLGGKVVEGEKRPSSDTPTHLQLYQHFEGIGAIIHTHSAYATVFAQAKRPIECLGTTHADEFYGEIPVTRELTGEEIAADYERNTGKVIVETFGKAGLDALEIPACLVSSHGPFVWGKTIGEAIDHSILLEHLAMTNLETIRLNLGIGPIDRKLLDKHYLRKHGKNSYYGQR